MLRQLSVSYRKKSLFCVHFIGLKLQHGVSATYTMSIKTIKTFQVSFTDSKFYSQEGKYFTMPMITFLHSSKHRHRKVLGMLGASLECWGIAALAKMRPLGTLRTVYDISMDRLLLLVFKRVKTKVCPHRDIPKGRTEITATYVC